jgi:hypothetical protein
MARLGLGADAAVIVIPAKAGIQQISANAGLGSRFRGNDEV